MKIKLSSKAKMYIRYTEYALIAFTSFFAAKKMFQEDRMYGIFLVISTIFSIDLFFSDWFNNIKNTRQIQENKKGIRENKERINEHTQQINEQTEKIQEQEKQIEDLSTESQDQKKNIDKLFENACTAEVEGTTLCLNPIQRVIDKKD